MNDVYFLFAVFLLFFVILCFDCPREERDQAQAWSLSLSWHFILARA